MRFYYDTEFAENGRIIRPLSIGIVAGDGREYYAVVDRSAYGDEDWTMCAHINPWLVDNVYPHLPIRRGHGDWGMWEIDPDHPEASAVKPREQVRDEVHAFINADLPGIEFWSNFGRYDDIVLTQLFGSMRDWPKDWPIFTFDLQQEIARLGRPGVPAQEDGLHNALADARYNCDVGEYLVGYASPAL